MQSRENKKGKQRDSARAREHRREPVFNKMKESGQVIINYTQKEKQLCLTGLGEQAGGTPRGSELPTSQRNRTHNSGSTNQSKTRKRHPGLYPIKPQKEK